MIQFGGDEGINTELSEEQDAFVGFRAGARPIPPYKSCRYKTQLKCEDHCDNNNICVTACYDVTVKTCTLNKR